MSETTENNDKITDGNGNNVSHIPNVVGSEINPELIRIEFRFDEDDVCHDPCERRKEIMIGSGECVNCKYCEGSEDDASVTCSWYTAVMAKRQGLKYNVVD
jgi:hypothetical protein